MSEINPLLEWNRLNKETAEHGVVKAMFNSMVNTNPIIDKFSMWLFAGTGATGALLITQIDSVIYNMSLYGFKSCMFMLIVSSIFAFIAKFFSLHCQIGNEAIPALLEKAEHIAKNYKENKKNIEERAKEQGIELETNISMDNIMKEYIRPFPIWTRWMINHSFRKAKDVPLLAYHSMIRAYNYQSIFTFLQALMFIGFMYFGWYYAGSGIPR